MKNRHKQYITEWKSINDDVEKLSMVLSKMIWRISRNDKVKIGSVINKPYVEGNFSLELNKYIESPQDKFGSETLNVNYILYFFDDAEDYNNNIRSIGSSECDFDTKTITVRGGIIEGFFNFTITQEIYHELEHIFQYGMGMEKRTTLYNNVVKTIQNTNDEVIVAVAKLIYYTFPHEQDAFVHQFYGLIKNEKVEPIENMFEMYLMNYSEYRNLIAYYDTYKQNLRNNQRKIIDFITSIGMNYEQFNKRIHFGRMRLKRKLKKAFQRYCVENNMNEVDEHGTHSMMRDIVLENYRKMYKNVQYEQEKHLF